MKNLEGIDLGSVTVRLALLEEADQAGVLVAAYQAAILGPATLYQLLPNPAPVQQLLQQMTVVGAQ